MRKRIFNREKYLTRIRPFYHSNIIKIITGIRRCGKSCMMNMIMQELNDLRCSNASNEIGGIVYLPLDNRGFKSIKTADALEDKIDEFLTSAPEMKEDKQNYILIDEVQNVRGFESVVHAYQEEGYSIFVTGSNSYLLSDEISTKLTGRYINFEIFPLDFKEYIDFKKYYKLEIDEDIDVEFNGYIINGGFPQSLEFVGLQAKQEYTRSVIQSIFQKDVKSRNKIMNLAVFERVQDFLVNNYSSPFSLSGMMKTLKSEGFAVKESTVRRYIHNLVKAKILYECNRFDLKSKKSLKREQKYYLADIAIFFATNADNRLNYGPTLENLVYLYLISNGYQLSVGRYGAFECDFVARDTSQSYIYIQVAYTLQGENAQATKKIVDREYKPFRVIQDSYPRCVITLDKFVNFQSHPHNIRLNRTRANESESLR